MKIIQINYSDIQGGAARAAYRIHHAVRRVGLESYMWVDTATSGDWTVCGPNSKIQKGFARLRPTLGEGWFKPFFRTENAILHSPAILPSGRVKELNDSDADILHLHWVAGEMISISEIGRLRKPVVWTLHDMWAFCGAEHYTEEFRWRQGYHKGNRPAYESGFDLNRWVWNRKRRHWQRPMHIVVPSRWLGECARESALLCGWPVSVIPNPIDIDCWQPLEQTLARNLLGLPNDVPLLLFGAMGGGRDPRKGFDLLLAALRHLCDCAALRDLQLVVFGQLAPKSPPDLGFPIHYTGLLHDDLSLRVLYSAADVMVIPSRQDNLPNTGVEALACGTPVVAFNVCGLPDIVVHQRTGYLATPFEPEDLARGILWVLSDKQRHANLSSNARAYAMENFASSVVAEKYKELYERVISSSSNA